tara:strand:+ start:85 stop:897 length:813 start_codon:yes stop_codon:yes gene_type:complete
MEAKDLNQISAFFDLLKPGKIVILVIGLIVLVKIVKLLQDWSEELGTKFPSKRLFILQVTTILSFSFYIFGGVGLFMSTIQPGKEIMVAVGGSLAVAIGFAIKDVIGSLFAGIILLFDRPFHVGDRVQFADTYGEIKSIGLRAVRLNTLDDNLVTIPNSKFITDIVASGNAGALDMMVVVKFHTSIDEDIEKVKALIHEVMVTSRFVYLEKPVAIVVEEVEFALSPALKFLVKSYVLDVRYEKALQTDIVTRVSEVFKKENIMRPGRTIS